MSAATVPIKRKTIEIKLQITSGTESNYALCEFIEQILLNSALNNSIYKLEIVETKITKEE